MKFNKWMNTDLVEVNQDSVIIFGEKTSFPHKKVVSFWAGKLLTNFG